MRSFVAGSVFVRGFMSSSEYTKLVLTHEVVLMMSKITEDKLTGPNYLDWSKTIRLYLRSILMANHLDKDPPTDDLKERWLENDACLFLQICNSINGKVLTLINQCEFVKELMEYLEFVYSSKGNSFLQFFLLAFYKRQQKGNMINYRRKIIKYKKGKV